MSPPRPRVVVIGGGVIGCAVAWRLARRDASVVLVERDRPGAHASSAAAGMLSPLKEAAETGAFLDFGLRSLERYPGFVKEVESAAGMDVAYHRDGRLDVALDDAGVDGLRRHRAMQERAGFDSRLLEPAELRRLEPELHADVRLGLATEHDHQVDARRLLRALWIAAEREGVEIRTGTAVGGVETRSGRTAGVRLRDATRIQADVVVVAAGPWSGHLELPRPLPVRPVRGQIVVLHTVPPVLGRTTWGPGGYLVPRRDGRLLVGSTMEEVGFDVSVTASAVRRLLDDAVRLVPALADARVDGFQVGLRPAAPDGRPVLGRDPEVEGLLYATGHFRNGILLAPETAERIAAIVLEDAGVDPAFDPARLTDPAFDPARLTDPVGDPARPADPAGSAGPDGSAALED